MWPQTLLRVKLFSYLQRAVISLEHAFIRSTCQCVAQTHQPFFVNFILIYIHRYTYQYFSLDIYLDVSSLFLSFETVPWTLMDMEMIHATWRQSLIGRNPPIWIRGTGMKTTGSWWKYFSLEGLRGVLHSEGGWSTGNLCS